MRLRLALLALVFLPLGISPQAKPVQAKRKGAAMTQRVLYSPAPVSDAVREAKPGFLGKSAHGAWFSLDDAAALKLRKDDSSVTMLYPDRAEYDRALEGLDETQVQEAIAWRHKVWTPRAAPELMGDLFEKEKTFLARLARFSAQPDGARCITHSPWFSRTTAHSTKDRPVRA